MLNAMHLLAMTLQRAALRETLFAKEALVRSHTCMRPRMPLEVERIIEALSAERTQITLHVTMTLHVTIKKSLKTEVLAAYAAGKAIGIIVLLSKKSKSYHAINDFLQSCGIGSRFDTMNLLCHSHVSSNEDCAELTHKAALPCQAECD